MTSFVLENCIKGWDQLSMATDLAPTMLQLNGAMPPVAVTVPTGVSGAMALKMLLHPLRAKVNGPATVIWRKKEEKNVQKNVQKK